MVGRPAAARYPCGDCTWRPRPGAVTAPGTRSRADRRRGAPLQATQQAVNRPNSSLRRVWVHVGPRQHDHAARGGHQTGEQKRRRVPAVSLSRDAARNSTGVMVIQAARGMLFHVISRCAQQQGRSVDKVHQPAGLALVWHGHPLPPVAAVIRAARAHQHGIGELMFCGRVGSRICGGLIRLRRECREAPRPLGAGRGRRDISFLSVWW
jgi:hypothetical protein